MEGWGGLGGLGGAGDGGGGGIKGGGKRKVALTNKTKSSEVYTQWELKTFESSHINS